MLTVLAAALFAPAGASSAQGVPVVDLVVAATTDVHGQLRGWDYYADTADRSRGLARAATIVDSLRALHKDRVILVDGGDMLQGNPLAYVAARIDTLAPHPVIAAMNLMGYDAAAIGNHEFDFGLPALWRVLSQARFPVVAANARLADDDAPAWPAYVIIERGGVTVAIIGVTTPGSMIWNRANLAGKLVISDIIPALRSAVAAARADGVDAVVVVAHAGLDGPSNYDTTAVADIGSENPMAQVAREVPGIDLIINGHSHGFIKDTLINGVLLTQPEAGAASVAIAHLRFEQSSTGWKLLDKSATVVKSAGHPEQQELVESVAKAHEAARRYVNTVVGSTAGTLRADSSRVAESPLINFVLATMRQATGATLTSTPSFALDATIPKGSITIAQLARLYPQDNTIRVLKISGAQLRAYLEQSARYFRVIGEGKERRVVPDSSMSPSAYEIVDGIHYTIDLTRPPGSRITSLRKWWRSVAATDSFTIALSGYRAGGADGYTMLAGAPVVRDTQVEIRQLLIDEVMRLGTIRPRDYSGGNWRVVPAPLGTQAYRAMMGMDIAEPPRTSR